MFVPLVFTLEVSSEFDHLMPFYKYLDMVKGYGWPIIAQEKYFNDLEYMASIGVGEGFFESLNDKFLCGRPTQSDLDSLRKYRIPMVFERDMISEFPSQMDAWIYLLKHSYRPLEALFDHMLADIIATYEEPIEGIICFCPCESMKKSAAKKGIPTIYLEGGPIRPPAYKRRIMYFDFETLAGEGELGKRYLRFQEERKQFEVPILTRKEIFELFLDDVYQKDINLIDSSPDYEVGVLMSGYTSGFHLQHNHMTHNEIQILANRLYPREKILDRGHPSYAVKGEDGSPSSFHFICKCKRIAGTLSNVLLEAMLIGRISCSYSIAPYTFMCNKGLSDPNNLPAPLDFVNFIIFGYCFPLEWMDDFEYFRFRLTDPPERDIYMRTLQYYLYATGNNGISNI